MRINLATLVIATCGLAATGIAQTNPASPPAKPAAPKTAATPAPTSMRAIATTKQLMHLVVIPSSDKIFAAGGEPPKNDDAWKEIYDCAVALAESGNLLMVGSRAQDRTTWLQYSRAMIDAAAIAAKAAEAKSADALSMASDQVYETCETCHTKYLKK